VKRRDFLVTGGIMLLLAYGATVTVTFGVSRLVLRDACPPSASLDAPPPLPLSGGR
jgi:hypothetical protein